MFTGPGVCLGGVEAATRGERRLHLHHSRKAAATSMIEAHLSSGKRARRRGQGEQRQQHAPPRHSGEFNTALNAGRRSAAQSAGTCSRVSCGGASACARPPAAGGGHMYTMHASCLIQRSCVWCYMPI